MKKFIAITLIILSIMCCIVAFTAKGVEIYKLNKDNIQTNSKDIVADNISLKDIHTPERESREDIETDNGKLDEQKQKESDKIIQEQNQKVLDEIIQKQKDLVAKSKVNRVIDPQKPMVALTFDDGPHPKYTMQILNYLKKYNGLATFFVLGNRAEKYRNVIESINESGNQIGNHTYNHKELTRMGSKAITNEITKTTNILQDITNIKTSVVRPTYGSVNGNVKSYAGAPLILWSIDTLDWKTRNKKMIVKSALGEVKDGDIILMHDIYKTTAMAAEVIIKELSTRGYQLVTVDELYKARGIDLVNGKVYGNAHKKKVK